MTEHHGTVSWSELNTRDIDKAKAYYAGTCGWSFEAMPMEDGTEYTVAMRDGQPVAGIFPLDQIPGMEDVPPHWFTYLAVDDVDQAVEDTVTLGGSVHRPAFDVPGTGRIAIVEDPSGARVGLMTPEDMPG